MKVKSMRYYSSSNKYDALKCHMSILFDSIKNKINLKFPTILSKMLKYIH